MGLGVLVGILLVALLAWILGPELDWVFWLVALGFLFVEVPILFLLTRR